MEADSPDLIKDLLEEQSREFTDFLIFKEDTPIWQDKNGVNSLMLALAGEFPRVAKLLIDFGSKTPKWESMFWQTDKNGRSALRYALKKEYSDIAKSLIDIMIGTAESDIYAKSFAFTNVYNSVMDSTGNEEVKTKIIGHLNQTCRNILQDVNKH